jgi:two-component system chemotaxis response regulator CheB
MKIAEPAHIVVVGTSAGGINALSLLIGQLQQDWDAAYFFVMHMPKRDMTDFMVQKLQPHTNLTCRLAENEDSIRKGQLYFAASNAHLMVRDGKIRLGHGPEENRWRPSIDVLFRSAAAFYNSRVTGIILTGLLDDGTAGMQAIKKCGGNTIVQSPADAEYPSMPNSVLFHMEVDFTVPVAEMGGVLQQILDRPESAPAEVPSDVLAEAEMALKMSSDIPAVQELGDLTNFTCPDCGGSLYSIKGHKLSRFRCFTGHVYNEADLDIRQGEVMESTLWVALRIMEERRNLLAKMAQNAREKGYSRMALENEKNSERLQVHIDRMKEILFQTQESNVR